MLSKRSTKRETETATIRRWKTPDGDYAIDEIRSKYGLPDKVLVVQILTTGERKVSEHRTRSAAIKALAKEIEG